MPWTKNDYPVSMKNLSKDIRNKAIEIANALLEEGYEEGRAISIGISQAEKMYDSDTDKITYHIVPHNNEWAIQKEEVSKATEVFPTKEKALDKGRSYVETKNITLMIHRQDGTIERVQNN